MLAGGGSGMAIFDLLGAGFLVIFLYHRGPGAVSSELGMERELPQSDPTWAIGGRLGAYNQLPGTVE